MPFARVAASLALLVLSGCVIISDEQLDDVLDQDGDGYIEDDCDPLDADVHPEAFDVPYDGEDRDCQGDDDFDQDGDGSQSDLYGGEDCDDTDEAMHPGADETPYDDLDQDCDGGDLTDVDADGHDGEAVRGGDDCDDTDADVNPNEDEVPYNEADDDCDEETPDDDLDGDGYGSELLGGEDCDDEDPAIGPQATETWYDGVDQDCDGASDLDQDGDGHDAESFGGEDCDDTDASFAPDAEEICGDGGVNDCGELGSDERETCIGGPEIPVDDATAIWTSDEDDVQLGESVAVGDLTGDGVDDLLIGAPTHDDTDRGAIYVLAGPVSGGAATVGEDGGYTSQIRGEITEESIGFTLSAGDVDEDGYEDLFTGTWFGDGTNVTGASAYLISGPAPAGSTTLSDTTREAEVRAGSAFLREANMAGDMDGDGREDLVVGCFYCSVEGVSGDAAFVLLGPVSGAITLSSSSADFSFYSGEHLGVAVDGAGDVNGDGFDDLVLGNANHLDETSDPGYAYLFYGPLSGRDSISTAAADLTLSGASNWDHAGLGLGASPGDTNGDGFDDLAIGAPDVDCDDGSNCGAAYVVLGGSTLAGSSSLSAADATIRGEVAYDEAGRRLSWLDLDADGLADLAIASPGNAGGSGTHATPGAVLYGPVEGEGTILGADLVLTYDGTAQLGESIEGGDVTGDGVDDLLLGDQNSSPGGSVHLFAGISL